MVSSPPTQSFIVWQASIVNSVLFLRCVKNLTSAFRNQNYAFAKVKTCQADTKKTGVSLFLYFALHTVTPDFASNLTDLF